MIDIASDVEAFRACVDVTSGPRNPQREASDYAHSQSRDFDPRLDGCRTNPTSENARCF